MKNQTKNTFKNSFSQYCVFPNELLCSFNLTKRLISFLHLFWVNPYSMQHDFESHFSSNELWLLLVSHLSGNQSQILAKTKKFFVVVGTT